jgi:hypothetical protein
MNSDLSPAVVAALGLILAMIAGGLFSYQLTLLGIAFAIATIITICCGLYLQFWQRIFGQPPKRSIPLIGAFLSLAAIITGWAETKPAPNLSLLPNSALVSNVEDRVNKFSRIAAINSADHTLLPITVLTFTHILNTRETPLRIIGYSMEYAISHSGPWIRLCRVDLERQDTVYWIPDDGDLSKATAIPLQERFDEILRRGPIPPHDIISAWSAWYCPALAVNCDQVNFAFTAVDAAGITQRHDIEKINTDITPDLLPGAYLGPGIRRVDLSGYVRRWPATCPQH